MFHKRLTAILMAILPTFAVSPSTAGTLDPTAPPDNPSTAMFTLSDIYARLESGALGTKRIGDFVEPSNSPAPTGRTLNEIMAKMPTTNSNAASREDVLEGKTFWSLQTSTWGQQHGTMCATNLSPDTTTMTAGYYSATNLTFIDTDLTASNIATNISIFGIAGTLLPKTFPAPVPQTGQTRSFATQDDGALQKGVPLPKPRFVDNDDGTVIDKKTGLIWLKKACPFGLCTWTQALDKCATLANGMSDLTDNSAPGDWRLPNIEELQSLINWGLSGGGAAISNAAGTDKWTPGDPFTDIIENYYWSSTTRQQLSNTSAWSMHPGGSTSPNSKTEQKYAWPVRDAK